MKVISIILILSILLNFSFRPAYAEMSQKAYAEYLLRLLLAAQEVKTKQKSTKEDSPKKEKPEEKINEVDFKYVPLGKLLSNPESYVGTQLRFRGEFNSFVTLALDYQPAMRSSKDFISFCIYRPNTKIPLSELKLAYPLEKAKDNPVFIDLGKGDLIEIFGKVFSSALDEPWVDVLHIKIIKAAPKKDDQNHKAEKELIEDNDGK